MSEIIDEMLEEARQVGFQIGSERSYERTMLESVRSIVKNLHLTAEEALKALDVPSEEWSRYLAML